MTTLETLEVKRLGNLIGKNSAKTMPDWKYAILRSDYTLALRRMRDVESKDKEPASLGGSIQ